MSDEIKQTAPAVETTLQKVEDQVKKFKWSRIGEFFEENPGEFSMTRLITFLIIIIPLLGWLIISIAHWALTDYPGGVLSLQFGALGSKLIQKGQETNANKV